MTIEQISMVVRDACFKYAKTYIPYHADYEDGCGYCAIFSHALNKALKLKGYWRNKCLKSPYQQS